MNGLVEERKLDWTDEDYAEAQRLLCQTSLKYLCKEVLGMKDWDVCHDQLAKFLKNSKKNKKLILLPREHLKTSIVTIGTSIQHILNDPNCAILYSNAVRAMATSFLSETKDYLTTKSCLPSLFGQFRTKETQWNDDQIRVAQRRVADKTPTVSVAGADSATTSQHYDYIYHDDIVNLQTINTPDQIHKTFEYYSTSLDLLKKPNGVLYVIGTRWDDNDLYGTILERWKDDFDILEMSATANAEVDGEVIFPKKFNTNVLRELLRQKGSYQFYAQYMNKTVSRDTQHFKPPVRYWTELPKKAANFITLDLAISEKQDADYTVILRCARGENGQRYVVDYERGHFTPSETISKTFEMVSRCGNGPVSVGIESVAYQKALIYLIEEEKAKRKLFFDVVPIAPHRDKFTRILTLQPLWERGDILLKQGMVELEDELARFPRGKHDDLLDALAMQLFTPDSGTGENRVYVPSRWSEGSGKSLY